MSSENEEERSKIGRAPSSSLSKRKSSDDSEDDISSTHKCSKMDLQEDTQTKMEFGDDSYNTEENENLTGPHDRQRGVAGRLYTPHDFKSQPDHGLSDTMSDESNCDTEEENDEEEKDVSLGSKASNKINYSGDKDDNLDDDQSYDFLNDHKKCSYSKGRVWQGCPMEDLPRAPQCYVNKELPILRNTDDHHVFFIPHKNLKEPKELPQPEGGEFQDNGAENDNVKLPFSKTNDQKSQYAFYSDPSRWHLIENTLKGPIPGCFELQAAIWKYNRYQDKNGDSLIYYFTKYCSEEDCDTFFTKTLPAMVKLALALPHLFKKNIPFLKTGIEKKLTFSQQQVACLLANAFFCTFPRRDGRRGQYPNINFSSLFSGPSEHRKVEKIKCIIHYFERVTTSMPNGVITYARQVYRKSVNWIKSSTKFSKLHMSPEGTIEDVGLGMLQVDFANKYVGGGVLGNGCVQEEIRFLICPEMIVSRLFTEVLGDDEVLIMTGCERFSSYDGYADSFRWKSDYTDDGVERDSWGRKYTEVVAMDALYLRKQNQFEEYKFKRELHKAYIGFLCVDPHEHRPAVCTGNWGCGAFGGDSELKALIQIMAASQAGRDICYLSVGDNILCKKVIEVYQILVDEDLAVGDVFDLIKAYCRNPCGTKSLFSYILDRIQ